MARAEKIWYRASSDEQNGNRKIGIASPHKLLSFCIFKVFSELSGFSFRFGDDFKIPLFLITEVHIKLSIFHFFFFSLSLIFTSILVRKQTKRGWLFAFDDTQCRKVWVFERFLWFIIERGNEKERKEKKSFNLLFFISPLFKVLILILGWMIGNSMFVVKLNDPNQILKSCSRFYQRGGWGTRTFPFIMTQKQKKVKKRKRTTRDTFLVNADEEKIIDCSISYSSLLYAFETLRAFLFVLFVFWVFVFGLGLDRVLVNLSQNKTWCCTCSVQTGISWTRDCSDSASRRRPPYSRRFQWRGPRWRRFQYWRGPRWRQ